MTNLFETPKTPEMIDPNSSLYETLVGNDKKFKTNEDLAKAKLESDRFIEQLKGELAGIRQELSTRETLEKLMDKFNNTRENQNTNHENNQNSNGGDGENNAKSFSEADINRLVEEKLTAAERARVHNSNIETVRKALEESFGNDYVTHLKAKATELGVTEEYLQNMAKETPKAFLKLVEANGPSGATRVPNSLFSPPTGLQSPIKSNSGFSPTGTPKKSYYDELKRKNPSEYWSPAIQNKMHKDAIALGESFFDTE